MKDYIKSQASLNKYCNLCLKRRTNLTGSFLVIILMLCMSCVDSIPEPYKDGENTIFTSIPQSHSNIDFKNNVKETWKHNT